MRKILGLAAMAMGIMMTAGAQEAYPDAPPPRQPIVKAEYFFDTDPGFGNGTAIPISAAVDISNIAATISLTENALNNGVHYLYLRTQDGNGRWSIASLAFFDNFVLTPYEPEGNITSLSAAEYFIDTDPGPGNGIPISLPAIADATNINVVVSLLSLTPGAHRLFLRTKDVNGKWSISNYAVFDNALSTPYPVAPSPAPPISQGEYYIDNDPGFGNGTAITLPASPDIKDFSVNVPLTGVSLGKHTIYVRSKQNPWSLSAYADFFVGSTLPVQWLYVKGEAKERDAYITWATGVEENTDKFIIEYSFDGMQFSTAGEVAATGNANGGTYNFKHSNAGTGAIWYRIKQLDKDGRSIYSKIIMLVFRKDSNSPVLFPNPAQDIVHIALPKNVNDSRVSIYDANGRVVYQVNSIPANQPMISIPIQSWTKGLYYVSIELDGKKQNQQFVKQ